MFEPVIPDIPMQPHTQFLAIPSFKRCGYAKVCSSYDVDPDTLMKHLVDQYPGLPDTMLNSILVDTLVAAAKVPADHLYRLYVTMDSARVQSVRADDVHCTLWSEFTPSKFT